MTLMGKLNQVPDSIQKVFSDALRRLRIVVCDVLPDLGDVERRSGVKAKPLACGHLG
jgi:hypothetical protein